MASKLIDEHRVQRLNEKAALQADYTLYWMQQSQRAECNHALEFAVQRANQNNTPLLVVFGLTDDYPEANLRHYQFMLQGLSDVAGMLKRRSIGFVVRKGSPDKVAIELAKDACEVICDRGYLRHQVQWRRSVAKHAECLVWQVESDAIVPVEVASDKREYAARTIRSKLNEAAKDYFRELRTTPVDKAFKGLSVDGLDISDIQSVLGGLSVDRSVRPVEEFRGGTEAAKSQLKKFLSESLSDYGQRTSVMEPKVSLLSPYLHFGQISPLAIALEVNQRRGVAKDAKESFIEELLVRRELAINFVHYEANYDSLDCLPDWAAETLEQHEDDQREHHYTSTQLENAQTHDTAWNAAMTEMKHRGYLHNHLRMYWGKKIIEWTNTTRHAYNTALELNNKYFLDGRDANSFTNVAWLFGLHDRAHQERPIFGKVRYMSSDGLKRKIDVKQYIANVEEKFTQD